MKGRRDEVKRTVGTTVGWPVERDIGKGGGGKGRMSINHSPREKIWTGPSFQINLCPYTKLKL
jgi:hypothetical protein